MTKIYEALEEAGKERGQSSPNSFSLPSSPAPKAVEEKLLALYRRIEMALEGRQGKVIEFAAAQAGDDSSRIVISFAKLVVSRLGKKVLILSTGGPRGAGSSAITQSARGWEAVIRRECGVDDVLAPVGGTGLVAGQIASSDAGLPGMIGSPEFREILNALRSRFDLVLLDAPSIATAPTAELLAGSVDGVVLVVEAGRTRWQVVRNAIEQIEAQKGVVLGVVLNKVRHYIPDFIYRKLL
jgi:Mrp family chromosome partitioning ATPase